MSLQNELFKTGRLRGWSPLHYLFLLFAGLLAGGCAKEAPSFIFISLDTLRADTMGLYGYGRKTTPFIDNLAAHALVFDEAVTVSNNTLISHTSMLTGLYPAAHGTTPREGGAVLNHTYTTLAEDFLAAGYQTGGFAAHSDWISERFGLDQGFEVFRSRFRDAKPVLKEAKAWFDKIDRKKPYFLFVHLYDIHSDFDKRPYQSKAPFHGAFTRNYDGPLKPWKDQTFQGSEFLKNVNRGKVKITEEDAIYLKAQYDEGVAHTDHQLGQFLKSLGNLENTYLIITADHGEEFYEHGRMLHGSLYDEVVRIPLIFLPPPGERERLGAPRRIPEQVRTIDFRPTFAALAGLPPPKECQGVNLLPWLRGKADCPADLARLYQNNGIRYGGYKYIKAREEPELYDLGKDPSEQNNLAFDEGLKAKVEQMHALLEKELKSDEMIRERHLSAEGLRRPEDDPEADDRLRQLGYM